MKKKKYLYDIGDDVIVKATVVMVREGNKKKLVRVPLSKPIKGKVCGMKRRWEGRVKADRNIYTDHEEYGQPHFIPEKSHLLYLVREGMLNLPVEVLEEDMELMELMPLGGYDLPLFKSGLKWSEEYKKDMSEWSKDFPRDEKGRFCK